MYHFRELQPKTAWQALVATALVVAVGAGAVLYYVLGFYAPSIVQRGQVTVASARDSTKRLTAATRLIAMRTQFWQVEYPDGVWNDCHHSCAETLRKAAFHE